MSPEQHGGPAAGDPLASAAAAVAAGGVIAIPTDTVYGLGCDPRDARAVDRVYRVKRRPAGLELTLLGAEAEEVEALVEMTAVGRRLAAAFWPGPLSLILPARDPRRHLAIPRAGNTLSVRVPDHDLLRALLRRTGPLATTSANRHGEQPAASAAGVAAALGSEIDAVVDGGPCPGVASTIIDCCAMPARVVRPGPLGPRDLRPHLEG